MRKARPVRRPPGRAGTADRAQAAQALAVSKCMRAHGVPNWPDPTTHVPFNVNAEGYGVTGAVPNSSLVYLIPKSIDFHSPAVKRATKTCQSIL